MIVSLNLLRVNRLPLTNQDLFLSNSNNPLTLPLPPSSPPLPLTLLTHPLPPFPSPPPSTCVPSWAPSPSPLCPNGPPSLAHTPFLSPRAPLPPPRVFPSTACTHLISCGASLAPLDVRPYAHGVNFNSLPCANSIQLVGGSGTLFHQGNVASTIMATPTIFQCHHIALQDTLLTFWLVFSPYLF
jgi:hypothetical protein